MKRASCPTMWTVPDNAQSADPRRAQPEVVQGTMSLLAEPYLFAADFSHELATFTVCPLPTHPI